MVRCDDTGMVYALQAERYYDSPDADEYQWSCEECSWFDGCPDEGVNWGICEDRGEWKHRDDEECGRFLQKEEA